MIVMLLSLILLAAFVFYIFNTGQHVTYRMETQNAADNAAISGAGWVARSFNTVAMNNVEMSRLIPLVAVLDSVPVGVAYTLEDQEAVLDAINRQLEIGSGEASELEGVLRNLVLPNIESQVQSLRPLNELLNSGDYDIAAMTFYQDASGQRGQIWQSIESLSALNVRDDGKPRVLSQFNAFRGAQIAQRDGGLDGGGLLLPWVPEVPWTLRSFEDFESVVADGRLPDDLDDPDYARGPFDTIFGLRKRGQLDVISRLNLGTDVRHNIPGAIPPPIDSVVERATVKTYYTLGTYELMLELAKGLSDSQTRLRDRDGRVRRSNSDFFPAPSPTEGSDEDIPLAPSRWGKRIAIASYQKIQPVFPGVQGRVGELFDPLWIGDYAEAVALQSLPNAVKHGMYLVFEFDSNLRGQNALGQDIWDDPSLIAWGFRTMPVDKSVDPNGGDLANKPYEKVDGTGSRIWKQERRSSGKKYIDYYMWVGVNVGEVIDIRNPFNFDEEERNALPGPVNFTPDEFPPNPTTRRESLTFLGSRTSPRRPRSWPTGSTTTGPTRNSSASPRPRCSTTTPGIVDADVARPACAD